MRKIIVLLFMPWLIAIFSFQALAQDKDIQKQEQEKLQRLKDETTYISPIRYVIVYNEIHRSKKRRIELIMDENDFREENLIKIFDLIKIRFPSPFALQVSVHTSLATIETPEERDKADSSRGRLTDKCFIYKTAFYNRFLGGREAFNYTTGLSPYERKVVVLIDKPISDALFYFM
jgi:hypothetical protein